MGLDVLANAGGIMRTNVGDDVRAVGGDGDENVWRADHALYWNGVFYETRSKIGLSRDGTYGGVSNGEDDAARTIISSYGGDISDAIRISITTSPARDGESLRSSCPSRITNGRLEVV